MRTTLIILALCLSACDPIQINVPPFEIALPCSLAPDDCARSDAEFAQKFDAMSDVEQEAYVEEWGRPEPRTGFVVRIP